MTPADLDRFGEAIRGLAAMHGRDVTDSLVQLYWSRLKHWPLEEFLAAATHLLGAQFMPKAHDFEQIRKASLPTAAEAWTKVLRHIEGAYRTGRGLDDGGVIDRAVESLGGYRSLAHRAQEYLPIDERRFAEHFDQLLDVMAVRQALPNLSNHPKLSDDRRGRLERKP
jgi:hypothetical protein